MSKEELQEKLNLLENYCVDWDFEINTKKIEVIIL